MVKNVGQNCFPTVQNAKIFQNNYELTISILIRSDFDTKSLKKQTVQFQQFQKFRRKERNTLKTDYDEHGRPLQKIALLCGPPGLGKTTLAHTIARHAGYNIVEINASDDRSPEAFKLALENGTQMKSFLAKDNRPNCIILGEWL